MVRMDGHVGCIRLLGSLYTEKMYTVIQGLSYSCAHAYDDYEN